MSYETGYNYLRHEVADVVEAIREGDMLDGEIDAYGDYVDRDGLMDRLNDELRCDDSVTGNGSGSYTFDAREAAHNVADNLDLLAEVVEEFGGDAARMIGDPEGADVSIRCHLLRRAIDMALDELAEDVVAGEYSPRLAGTEA